jgi:aspartyl-tRNA(Asn)/glutamyl-tRNA(Gln) amidotransferase subunit A
MAELMNRPLTELLRLLSRRELSALELMEATLARIDACDGRIGAVVALADREGLLRAAGEAQERIDRGQARALEGIPLGVKDVEDAVGFPTTHGSVPFASSRPERDSVQVERLKAAGAIVVGKTNTPEWGSTAITKNLLFGVTRNPWDLERSPGGSSGGSAAAIAGGLLPMATASDGGGSIRLPASMTGCFGLKGSYGRVPAEGRELWVIEDTVCRGPLTRTVEDAALHLDVVAGPHPLDPNSLPHPGISYREVLSRLPEGLRIGFSPDLGFAVVQGDVAAVVEEAARVFAELGHRLQAVETPAPQLGTDWGLLGALEVYPKLSAKLPDHEHEFGRAFLRGVLAGIQITPERWGAVRRRRQELNRWCAEVFGRHDLLLTPTLPYDPPPAKGPFPEATEGRVQPPAGVASFTIPFNLSWHPAATVRAGFSKAGLPVGLQIVGPRHRDDLVLQAAHAFERARPWAESWPSLEDA